MDDTKLREIHLTIKSTLLVTYTAYSVQWKVLSAFNPSLRSSRQPQHPQTNFRFWLITSVKGTDWRWNLYPFFDRGRNRNTQLTLHIERSWARFPAEAGPSCYKARVLTTSPTCQPPNPRGYYLNKFGGMHTFLNHYKLDCWFWVKCLNFSQMNCNEICFRS